ncbi:cell division protein FtsZ [bacterium]|nr:cell division protein FtsZ [candidate division CSSED10-310 bacterium]
MIRFAESDARKSGANIKVIGVGGCGCNAVDRMIALNIPGVEFIAINTDTQALQRNQAPVKVQIGTQASRGLGAGGEPERGREAATEDLEALRTVVIGADMTFITAGMGGGTGTGAAPVIAQLAREAGSLTVAVVTKPFRFEGRKRGSQADDGVKNLRAQADTLLIIKNDNLLKAAKPNTSIQEAFKMADDVLAQAVRGISDLITIPGYINLDFADVRKIMSNMGMCLMGTGVASGEKRAEQAVEVATSSPLLEELKIDGAKGILINITGGKDLTLKEINEASTYIYDLADREANIIWGYVIDESYDGKVKVTVIATGFDMPHEGFKRQDVHEKEIEPAEETVEVPIRVEPMGEVKGTPVDTVPEVPITAAPVMERVATSVDDGHEEEKPGLDIDTDVIKLERLRAEAAAVEADMAAGGEPDIPADDDGRDVASPHGEGLTDAPEECIEAAPEPAARESESVSQPVGAGSGVTPYSKFTFEISKGEVRERFTDCYIERALNPYPSVIRKLSEDSPQPETN